jgi:hypothetical protein
MLLLGALIEVFTIFYWQGFHNFISDVKQPIAILGAEIDRASPPEVVKEFAKILTSKPEVNYILL